MKILPVTYEDFNGVTVTEKLCFHLNAPELVELQQDDDSLAESIEKISNAKDLKVVVAEVKKIILLSYGVRSEDGKRFIKNDQLREEFSQSAAFDALFMQLATNEDSAADFIKGIIPKELAVEVEKITQLPPPTPPNQGV